MTSLPRTDVAAAGSPFQHYPRTGSYDEMLDERGDLRSHWRPFVHALETLGLSELTRRWEEAKHLIREDRVTYNAHADPIGSDRPWELDPIPVVVSLADGQAIEAGLIQRARLLEHVLADLYGPQELVREGLLPPEVIFDNPGFLRPCHGLRIPANRYLHLYAADIGRSADGQFWVIADRAQAPSGAGYALENRIVLARTLPDVFRDCQVQRLALFFRSVRETLSQLAPHNRDNPRIVLLTPGPSHDTYFEHAYLARYLGFTLVEGGDLTVRDNRVFLKLLGGLQPVDVILHRLDDSLCDPLELRSDSIQGVPGLVQSIWAGNVAVANPLGSGFIESPALMPLLPKLCERLLDEPLKMPSVPTWWCGDERSREHVLSHLHRMIIKPAMPCDKIAPIFGESLSADQRDTLAGQIRARPRAFVGQEQLGLSTTPALIGSQIQSRHLLVRAFLTASNDSFSVMPGGLARVSATCDTLVVSHRTGGGSKDTWVLSPGRVSTFTLLRPTVQPVELSRGGGDLPSRAADNLYWLGRYVERAEGAVRLLRGILVRLTEKSGVAEVPELTTLLRALTYQGNTLPGFVGEGAEARLAAPEQELLSLVFDGTRAGSLKATCAALQAVAGMVRDRLSVDTWRVLINLELPPNADRRRPDRQARTQTAAFSADYASTNSRTLSRVLALLDQMVIKLAAFGGLAMESMTRLQGWRFLDMGRRLERSYHTISLLAHTLVSAQPSEGPLLEAVLEIADSSMTYRRRYLSNLHPAPVLDLLLADESNPRSLAFQLVALSEHVENLPRESVPSRSPEERIVLSSLTAVRLADAELLATTDSASVRPHLRDLLSRLEADIPVLSDTITTGYLSHVQLPRQLGTQSLDRFQ
jgi:uncharacterized circularly permuted ATP-grasp superfamily protein/uncharacterized alpha-E superfamily protein